MINPIILSDSNPEDAMMTFTLWLNDIYTLLVVTGTQPEALAALAAADEMINSGSVNYASVRAIHAPKPEFILPLVRNLKSNPEMIKIDWSQVGRYAILSISSKYNNIGDAFLNEDFRDESKGRINYLVLRAEAVDIPGL
jgi:hypothetical protein